MSQANAYTYMHNACISSRQPATTRNGVFKYSHYPEILENSPPIAGAQSRKTPPSHHWLVGRQCCRHLLSASLDCRTPHFCTRSPLAVFVRAIRDSHHHGPATYE